MRGFWPLFTVRIDSSLLLRPLATRAAPALP